MVIARDIKEPYPALGPDYYLEDFYNNTVHSSNYSPPKMTYMHASPFIQLVEWWEEERISAVFHSEDAHEETVHAKEQASK